MRALRALVVLASSLLLAASCAPEVRVRRSPIINGVLDNGHPAVGLLSTAGEPSCTATLVGSRTLFTAGHCLSDEEQAPYTLLDPIEFELDGKSYKVTYASIHSSYSGWSLKGDVGVARLAQPVPAITPALVASVAPVVGEALVVVGFGCSKTGPGSSQTFGTKRKGTNSISGVKPTELAYPIGATLGSLCEGDSGGPSFVTRGGVEQLVGIHSYDLDEESFDQRADAYRLWLEQEAQGDLYQGPPAIDAGPKKDKAAPRDAGPKLADRSAPPTPDVSPRDGLGPVADEAGIEPESPSGGSGCALALGARAPASPTLLLLLGVLVLTRRRPRTGAAGRHRVLTASCTRASPRRWLR